MSRLRRLSGLRISSEAFDVRFAQAVFFAASPAMLILAIIALGRNAATPGEIVVGLLAAGAVSLMCIVIGLVLPMSVRRAD